MPEIEPWRGAGLWTGTEMEQDRSWIHAFTPTQVEELICAAEKTRRDKPAIEAITRADFDLPGLAPVLGEINRDLLGGRGFALLRGLPVERMERVQLHRVSFGRGYQSSTERALDKAGKPGTGYQVGGKARRTGPA